MKKSSNIFRRNKTKGFFFLIFLSFSISILSHPIDPPVIQDQEKPHPALVDIAKANCSTCHEDMLKKKYVHSVVEAGCDSCHEMSKKDGETLVTLMEKGSALCLACHSEVEEAITRENKHPPVDEGCDLCHTPHASDFPNQLNSDWTGLCSECHDVEDDDFKGKHGLQPVAFFGCNLCHDPHGSDEEKLFKNKVKHAPFEGGDCNACHRRARGTKLRMRAEGADLCYACHTDKQEEFAKENMHTPVKRKECTGCHEPHSTEKKSLLRLDGNQLCLSCHSEIQELLQKENLHPPADESCQDCHAPHATDYPSQLIDSMVNICLACHDAEEEEYQKKHYFQDPEKLDCAECHNPHGSENEKLLNTYSHPPFLEKECETCHTEPGEDKSMGLVEEDINALCTVCHDDKSFEDTGEDMLVHAALEAEGCTACHSGHASNRKNLLIDHTSKLCITCHDDILEKKDSEIYIHAVIETHGCESCHESHFSKNEKLLLEKPNKLCLECHLLKPEQKTSDKEITLFGKFKIKESGLALFKKIALSEDLTRGHPQIDHIVSGDISPDIMKTDRKRKNLVFSGSLTCLSCHDSHKGASAQLFIEDITSPFQVCIKCHKK